MVGIWISFGIALLAANPVSANEAAITQARASGSQPSARGAIATPLDVASLAPSPSALAAASNLNASHIVQLGVRNNATVLQSGGGNFSSVVQQGSGNVAVVSQFNRR